jgi:hypothetical protein
MALVLPTLDPLITTPYNDPDAQAYGEVPTNKELEIRVAASPQGSGAFVERRTNQTVGLLYAERVGRNLSDLAGTPGTVAWGTGYAVAGHTGSYPSGYSGTNHMTTATAATGQGGAHLINNVSKNLSEYGSGTIIRLWAFLTSSTNLTSIQFRLGLDAFTNYIYWNLWAAGSPVGSWYELMFPFRHPVGSAGTLSLDDLRYATTVFTPSASYSGSLVLRDLRIGTTQTDKTTPDGHLVPEGSYDVRARFVDDAAATFTTTLAANMSAGATNAKYTAGTPVVGQELSIKGPAGFWETRTIITAGTSGSGGTGITVNEAFTYAHSSGDAIASHPWGLWSGWVTFKASLPPAMIAISPADFAVITDTTPDLVHDYTSIKAQARRLVDVYRKRGHINYVRAFGPESYWLLNDTSGALLDMMGVINGTLAGTATRGVTGPLVPADGTAGIDLGGSDSSIGFGNAYTQVSDAASAYLLGGWFSVDASSTSPRLWSKEAATNGFRLYWDDATGLVTVQRFNTSGGTTDTATSAQTIAANGSFHFVEVLFTGTVLQVVLDGVPGVPVASTQSLPGNTANMVMGASSSLGNRLNGKMMGWFINTGSGMGLDVAIGAYQSAYETPGTDLIYPKDIDGAGETDTLPSLLLSNFSPYTWIKTAWDTEELSASTVERTFFTSFATPATIANLVATADPESGAVVLTWDAAAVDHYRVYWRDAGGQLVRIDGGPVAVEDGRTPLTATTLTHYGARLGVNAYVVTAHNGAVESAPADAEVTLELPQAASDGRGQWMMVVDGDDLHTFQWAVTSAPREWPQHASVLSPPGLGYSITRSWGRMGRRGTFTFRWRPAINGNVKQLVADIADQSLNVWIKAPPGYSWDVMRGRITGMTDDVEGGAWANGSVTVQEVLAYP